MKNNSFKYSSILFLTLLLVVACAPKARVELLPMADGKNKVTGAHEDQSKASSAAIQAATEHCQKMGKNVAFQTEGKKDYQGTFDEKTDKKIQTAGKVAGILGSMDGAFVGSTIGQGDYKISYEFICQ